MEERDEFVDFLGQLVSSEQLEGPAGGIAKKVVADGSMSGLTRNQHYALMAGVTSWLGGNFAGYKTRSVEFGESPPAPTCSECPNEMPWSEVFLAENGRCSWCQNVHHKDED